MYPTGTVCIGQSEVLSNVRISLSADRKIPHDVTTFRPLSLMVMLPSSSVSS